MTIRGARRSHVVPITAPSFPTLPRPRLYRNIAYTFFGITVFLLVLVLWLSSVRAQVLVHVRHEDVILQTRVDLAREPKVGQLVGRVVQGVFESPVQEIVLARSTSSAAATVPIEPAVATSTGDVIAKGTVRLVNTLPRSVTLIIKTRLLTADEKLYRMEREVTIPATGSARVGVYADKLGEEFAIAPTRFTIPGLSAELQKAVYAVSDESFVAVPRNASRSAPRAPVSSKTTALRVASLVTRASIDEATERMKESVLEQAKRTLAAEVNDPRLNDVLYVVTSSTKTNVSVGQAADSFLASVRVDVTAFFFPKEDMQTLVRSKLKEKIPAGREFLPFAASNILLSVASSDTKGEVASVDVSARAQYRISPTNPLLQPSVIAGRSVAEASTIIRSIDGVDTVEIIIRPGWLRKLPALSDRIEMRVE